MKISAFAFLIFVISTTVVSQGTCDSILADKRQYNPLHMGLWFEYNSLIPITFSRSNAGNLDAVFIAPWEELQSLMNHQEFVISTELNDKDTIHFRESNVDLIIPKTCGVDEMTTAPCMKISDNLLKPDSSIRNFLALPEYPIRIDLHYKTIPITKW